MKKRIFIAIKISDEFGERIKKWEENLPGLKVRWVPKENLHITLIPPWYERNIEKIKDLISKVSNKGDLININFKRISFGPHIAYPRLIWATGPMPEELTALKKELIKILGKKEARKDNMIHLTLARFRPHKFFSFQIKKIDEEVDWKDRISSILLLQSNLLREGVQYEKLLEIKI